MLIDTTSSEADIIPHDQLFREAMASCYVNAKRRADFQRHATAARALAAGPQKVCGRCGGNGSYAGRGVCNLCSGARTRPQPDKETRALVIAADLTYYRTVWTLANRGRKLAMAALAAAVQRGENVKYWESTIKVFNRECETAEAAGKALK